MSRCMHSEIGVNCPGSSELPRYICTVTRYLFSKIDLHRYKVQDGTRVRVGDRTCDATFEFLGKGGGTTSRLVT